MPVPKTKLGKLILHPAVKTLPFDFHGPFVKLGPSTLLTVDDRQVHVSRNGGRTWKPQPLLKYAHKDKEYKLSAERAMVRTAKGTIVLAFGNLNEKLWLWKRELKDALPGTRMPIYAIRSLDGGKNWEKPVLLHEDWTGDLRCMLQMRSGRIVLSAMKLLHSPGRHCVITYSSDDEGATWSPGNILDLGGCGHHAGAVEATMVELTDGRLWMLIRTMFGRFYQAFSEDGRWWRQLGPSSIEASTAPGQLKRLASGRLMLAWNRPCPEGKSSFPVRHDEQWADVDASNHREELSIAFSEDDGATWTKPAVAARQRNGWLSYPHILEYRPGEIWLTTMQGGLRLKLQEADFV